MVAEVCDEASRVLARNRHRIRDDMIEDRYWAAWVYERAAATVRKRRLRT
jgi:hypothetical protein